MIIPSRALTGYHAHRAPIRDLPQPDDAASYTDDIDWHAVHRAISGEHPRVELNPQEAREAAICLRRNGIPRRNVSAQLCVYARLVKEWEAEAGLLTQDELCTTSDCPKPSVGRGLCATHLEQHRRHNQQWADAVNSLAVAA